MKRLLFAVSSLLAIVALVLLVVFASLKGGAGAIVGAALFGSALVLFHVVKALPLKPQWEEAFFYLLIAATYTPVALILPQRAWGWVIFGVAWGLCALALALKFFTRVPHNWILIGLYLSFITLDGLAFPTVHAFLTDAAFFWLSMGGASYVLAMIMTRLQWKFAPVFLIFGGFAHFWGMLEQILMT